MKVNIKKCPLLKLSVIFLLCVLLPFVIQRPTHSLKDNIPKGNFTKEDTLKFKTVPHFIIRSRMTWIEAHAACETYCSSLAYMEDVEKAKKLARAIKELMKEHGFVPDDYLTAAAEKKYEYGLDRRYWIGLNDIDNEGTWMWATKNIQLNYDLWYPAQPDHLPNGTMKANTVGEHCVVFWYPVFYAKIKDDFPTWNDEPCTNLHYAICNSPKPAAKAGRPCVPI